MKNIFKKVAEFLGNGRYIKLDGSSYHSSGVKALFETPAVKAAIISSIAIVGVNLMAQGSWDVTTDKMVDVIMNDCLKSLGFVLPVLFAADFSFQKIKPLERKAIDTKGTSLNRRELTVSDLSHLKTLRWSCILYATPLPIIHLTGRISELVQYGYSNNSMVMTAGAVSFATYMLSRAYIATKILNREYVVMENPPKKEVKSTENKTVTGGYTNPAP